MNTTHKSNNLVEISTDSEHILHRIGSEDYTEIRKTTTLNPNEWEEIAVADIPPYTKGEYKAKIVELIRRRYDQDDETGILRQRDSKPDEFAEYNAYVEQCKLMAKDTLTMTKETESMREE